MKAAGFSTNHLIYFPLWEKDQRKIRIMGFFPRPQDLHTGRFFNIYDMLAQMRDCVGLLCRKLLSCSGTGTAWQHSECSIPGLEPAQVGLKFRRTGPHSASITHHSNHQHHRVQRRLHPRVQVTMAGTFTAGEMRQAGTGCQLVPVLARAPGDLLTQTFLLWDAAANLCPAPLAADQEREDGGGKEKAEESCCCCWERHKGCLENWDLDWKAHTERKHQQGGSVVTKHKKKKKTTKFTCNLLFLQEKEETQQSADRLIIHSCS